MKTVTIKISFDAAKRLMEYKGKCTNLHGYHHVIEATFSNKSAKGAIVADFHDLRKKLGGWVEKNWDHNAILNHRDKKLGDAISKITDQKIYYIDSDPTAENLAEYLKDKICPKLFSGGIKCTKIRLYDNPESFVEIE